MLGKPVDLGIQRSPTLVPEAGKDATNEMNVRDDDAKDYLMAIVCCTPTFRGNFAASQCDKQETEVLVGEAVSRLDLIGLGHAYIIHPFPLSLPPVDCQQRKQVI